MAASGAILQEASNIFVIPVLKIIDAEMHLGLSPAIQIFFLFFFLEGGGDGASVKKCNHDCYQALIKKVRICIVYIH